MKIADAAVGEATLIKPAVDEAGAIATLSAQLLERQLAADFPTVGESEGRRGAQDVVVVSVIFRRTLRGSP